MVITMQALSAQLRFPQNQRRPVRSQPFTVPRVEVFTPLRSLYRLQARGYGDDALSSFIVQSALVKKDPTLAWQQHDIDDSNHMLLSYVERAVQMNGSYLRRRKLVEAFGQTNHDVLINRMRLVAVLLGSERGKGGMDYRFRAIREEAHRISPYVVSQVKDYLQGLEKRLSAKQRRQTVDPKFKKYVDTLGETSPSEYAAAFFGAEYRGRLVEEIYAMKVLLRDLKTYYGMRDEGDSSTHYTSIFKNTGTFKSETFASLKTQYQKLAPEALTDGFITIGLELRDHLSNLRAKNAQTGWGDSEQINHLKKLNEIVVSATGLFASARAKRDTVDQARSLVNLLFLEGLYSKKDRKALMKELSEKIQTGSGHEKDTRALHAFLGYMHGLAYAKLDEAFGPAARAFSRHSKHAERYLEIEARTSALQVLGQLEQEFYQQHPKILAGKKDIHLAGEARGTLKVFETQAEMSTYLRKDAANGGQTIWVLKSGLTMPNEASFAAIIMEDPIMKASHYDGYARSQNPPLPLMQIPGACKEYKGHDGKFMLLKASPKGEIHIEPTSRIEVSQSKPRAKTKLELPKEVVPLLEIDAPLKPTDIRKVQEHAGSKAGNYAFLRSTLPLDKAQKKQHIYPGFAIPYHYYQKHLEQNGVDTLIKGLSQSQNPGIVRNYLEQIRKHILNGRMSRLNLKAIIQQVDGRLMKQHPTKKGEALKLRFRSSSNAEDNKDFSGAGLYESHSALYTPGQGIGSKSEEDIAYAMKRVWASVWKPEAYYARQRAGIDQESVRMGILVHPSYRKEESTGVIYVHGPNDIEISVNDGNENVQNPRVAGLTPERHRYLDGKHTMTTSSCFALSGKDILSAKDRKKVNALLEIVVPKFQAFHTKQKVVGVDIEFKVMEVPDSSGDTKDVVMFKQIRPLAKTSR